MSSELEFIVQLSMNCISVQNTYSPRLNPSFLFRILPCRFRSGTESLRLQNYLLHRVHFRQCMTEKNVQLTCVCVCSYSYIDCIFISELLVQPVCSHVARRIRYVFQHINIMPSYFVTDLAFLPLLPPSISAAPPKQYSPSLLLHNGGNYHLLHWIQGQRGAGTYVQVMHVQCTSFLSLGCTP